MDICEATAGNRVILSVNVVGGVRRDLSPDQIRWMHGRLDELEKGMRELTRTMLDDYTVQERTRGIGILSKDDARLLGAAGPTLRGSGWEID